MGEGVRRGGGVVGWVRFGVCRGEGWERSPRGIPSSPRGLFFERNLVPKWKSTKRGPKRKSLDFYSIPAPLPLPGRREKEVFWWWVLGPFGRHLNTLLLFC